MAIGSPTGGVRAILRLEGLGVAGICLFWLSNSGWPWWAIALMALAPDLSFFGYAAGPRAGSALYNLAHSYLGPIAAALLAHLSAPRTDVLTVAAAAWALHIGVDRALGYGLKYASGFKDTHLGRL